MPKPDKIEFSIGQTTYGQPLRLTRSRDTGGCMVWTLYRDEANQRDDRVFISGLTDEHLRLLGDIVRDTP